MKLRPVEASLYTHVIAVPNDGIRRTGKARVRVRLTREEYKTANDTRERPTV